MPRCGKELAEKLIGLLIRRLGRCTARSRAVAGGEGESYSDVQVRAWLAGTGWEGGGEVRPLGGPAGLLTARAV